MVRLPRLGALALLAVGLCCLVPGQPVQGAEDTSLKLVPADVAFHSAMLRNKEQIDAVAKSKAWATFWKLPNVQMGWKQVQEAWNRPELAPARKILEDKELLDLLAEAASQEIFLSGSDAWIGFLQ